jgi:hypothetical protein
MQWRKPKWFFLFLGFFGLFLAYDNFSHRDAPGGLAIHHYLWIGGLVYAAVFFWRAFEEREPKLPPDGG